MARLLEAAPEPPRQHEASGEPQRAGRVVLDSVSEGRTNVVVLLVETGEPLELVGAADLAIDPLDEVDAPLQVIGSGRGQLVALGEPLDAVGAQ